jgi:hypothetical protein
MGKTPDPKPPCARRGLDAARAKASGRGATRRRDPAVSVVLAVAVEVARVARVVRHALYWGGGSSSRSGRARERLDSLGRIGPRAPGGTSERVRRADPGARLQPEEEVGEEEDEHPVRLVLPRELDERGVGFHGLAELRHAPVEGFLRLELAFDLHALDRCWHLRFYLDGRISWRSWRRGLDGARRGSLGGSWRRSLATEIWSITDAVRTHLRTTSATLASTTAPPPFVGVAPRLRGAPSTHARSARDPSLSGRRRGRSSRAPARPRGWTCACG